MFALSALIASGTQLADIERLGEYLDKGFDLNTITLIDSGYPEAEGLLM